jgi:hypothetical protein
MNLDEADKIIAELNVCFPSKRLTVEEVKRWEQNLQGYDFADARQALLQVEQTCKFWPAWAEFREALVPIVRKRLSTQEFERRELERRKELETPFDPAQHERTMNMIAEIKRNLARRLTGRDT